VGEAVRLQKSGKNLLITIPVEICEMLELKEGSEVEIEPFTCGGENGIRIKPKKMM
jgi:antitoxin component of MazEF toxin-antitoxin module